MEEKLKQSIRKTVLFMLITAVIPLLFFFTMRLPLECGFPVHSFLRILYLAGCFFVLVWGSTQVVFELPCRKCFRQLFFLAWLILYTALCAVWYYACMLCLIMVFH
jgi:hypothetical protein